MGDEMGEDAPANAPAPVSLEASGSANQASLVALGLAWGVHAFTAAGAVVLAARLTRYESPAVAQLSGHNFGGDFGLQSGSQPGPGVYLLTPFARYDTDTITDRSGNARNLQGDLVFSTWVRRRLSDLSGQLRPHPLRAGVTVRSGMN